MKNPLMSSRVSEPPGRAPTYALTFWDKDGTLLLDIMYLEDRSLKYCME
jgi:hypothetical protein